jgi:hypothetical protein
VGWFHKKNKEVGPIENLERERERERDREKNQKQEFEVSIIDATVLIYWKNQNQQMDH